MENKNVMILNVQAKDLINGGYIVDKTSKTEIDVLYAANKRVFSKYRGSMDYSLLTIYLEQNFKKFIKLDKNKQRLYSNDMITVNFDYSYVSEDLEVTKNKIKELYIDLKNIKKIKANKDKIDKLKEDIKSLKNKKANSDLSTVDLRNKLYNEGFTLNVNGIETKYVRLYRSSGSARDGKINFVNEKYYNDIIEYAMAGLEYKDKNNLDLPSIEAYISLIATSITDTFELSASNVLLIDDIESEFPDTVMATELINEVKDEKGNIISGDLFTDVAKKTITNKITDGEALLDKSIFIERGYGDKAILQIRNRMYKGIGVNTDIQQFFKDNNITDVSQLKGKTLAKDIKDIKLITTKSSIKYLKKDFNKTFEEWCNIALTTWGICKSDKGQHHNFNGMASTHYQLLNTLGMFYKEMEEFLQPSKDYISLLKNNTNVFKLHLKLLSDGTLKEVLEQEIENSTDLKELEKFTSNSEFILNMLKINEDFINTKICKKFRSEIIDNYISNIKKGHALVKGTYSTVISSSYEYLLASIGQFKGVSETLHPGECYTLKFKENEDVLAVRSPQPTMSNVTIMKNTYNEKINTYFNPTENVIFISGIGWNIMELLSSLDFDGDATLITNDRLLCKKCRELNEDITVKDKEGEDKTIKRFLVSTDFTPKTSIPRSYISEDLADTDIKCSEGKIGEVINLVQMLNSVYWDKKYNGASEEELLELYKDISNLNILSCIVIDSAKKSSPVNVKKEMDRIRLKNYLGTDTVKIYNEDTKKYENREVGVRPFFFKYLDGGKDYKFKKYECGMDYLVTIMNKVDRKDSNDHTIDLKSILVKQKMNEADRKKICKFTNLVVEEQIKISNVYKNEDLEAKEKYRQVKDIKSEYAKKFDKTVLSKVTIYTVIKRLDKAISVLDNNRKILKQQIKDLKKVGKTEEIEQLREQFKIDNKDYIQYAKIGRSLLRHLYYLDTVKFLSCFEVKSDSNILYRAEDGDINIYGVKYKTL